MAVVTANNTRHSSIICTSSDWRANVVAAISHGDLAAASAGLPPACRRPALRAQPGNLALRIF